jgi:dTDP-6-deoxy-L-talose 4-dehydrogenase (NAD+)
MKILVTGANGYIGKNVIEKLCNQKNISEIIACDINNNNLPKDIAFKSVNILGECEALDLLSQLGNPDVCIHLAWQDGFIHNSDAHMNNFSAHYKFLKNLIDSGCKNISVMGTMHEIGYHEGCIDESTPCNPMSLYGVAKNALRQAIMAYILDKDVSFKWLRAYYITGDEKFGNSIFCKILAWDGEGKEIFPFTDGKNKYDFIDVKELAEQIVAASLQTKINGIINVCSGKSVSLKDKVEDFIKVNNLKIRPEYGVFSSRKYDSPEIWGCNKKIKEILNG